MGRVARRADLDVDLAVVGRLQVQVVDLDRGEEVLAVEAELAAVGLGLRAGARTRLVASAVLPALAAGAVGCRGDGGEGSGEGERRGARPQQAPQGDTSRYGHTYPVRMRVSGLRKHWAHWSHAPRCSHIVDLSAECCQPAVIQRRFRSHHNFDTPGTMLLRITRVDVSDEWADIPFISRTDILQRSPRDRRTTTPDLSCKDPDWWRQAVVYQVYPRSFADADGDGLGDLPGRHRPRSPYLADARRRRACG